ncbi:DNA polymerase III subunit beta [Desulfosudis oleivorans]|uniref:Beta sliding clamp n=1 Tax=Desulfosudis oleivorans (strain DSM 6200 / JCM 39069 / Hxd3) TaxID=96561 RepID=A8ZRY7_DESOH|nr:DNA polymerase III subunit beta [Desulfosudis oleivorans]ABW65904.1 DNA polymerase III, beta subunit [Desulfosudis oleivorans Hxd3]
MKLSVEKKDIIEMLANVQGIAGKRSSLAITENILIKTGKEGISVSATDIETGFEGIYPATIENEGTIAINARQFYEIVKKIDSNIIYLREEKKQWIQISDTEDGSRLKYQIMGGETESFPQLPVIADVSYIDVNSADFKNMILWATVITSSGTEKRAHVIGANLEYIKDGKIKKIRMVSTDGKRLTKTEYSYKKGEPDTPETSTILPKKALNELFKFLKDEGTIQIGTRDNYFIVKNNNEIIYINLLSGEYPNLETLFSDEKGRTEIKINRKKLKDMLERMSILTTDNYKGVIFTFEKNILTINAQNPDRGESYEWMDIQYDKKQIKSMFNPDYFIDAVNLIEDDEVCLKLKEDQAPCIVCGGKHPENINIIMPMKI